VNVAELRDDMSEMLNQYVRYAARPKFDSMISEFVALLQRYGLRLDPQFMLAIKAAVQTEAVVAALGGHVDFVPFAMEQIKSLELAEITQEKVLDTVKQHAAATPSSSITQVGKELLRRVPNLQDATVSWIDQYMQGKVVVHVDTQDLTDHIDELGTSFNKLTAGLIVTGMIVGTAIVTTQIWQSAGEQKILPYAAMVVFVGLLVISARLVWRILHPPRRPYVE
jgi:predicted unusual protein kinase regulating ubiquinone biosynthesis (AarF/ABC1/UbiB family)